MARVDVPPSHPRFPRLAVTGLSIINLAGDIGLLLACPRDPGQHTVLRASAPLSPHRTTCTDFRALGFCPAPVQGTADITALYTARFRVPLVGARIFLQANHMIEGWQDHPRAFSAIVPPPA